MKLKLDHANSHLKLKFKNDLDRPVITENCLERNWIDLGENDEDLDFNFYWIAVIKLKNIFNTWIKIRLRNDQILNHFPNHFELTRKDLMIRNIKKYRPLQKSIQMFDGTIMDLTNNIVPITYILPQEYSLFYEEFQKDIETKWIFKPANQSQGKGIQIINKLQQVKQLSQQINQSAQGIGKQQTFVICKYIDNPFLIQGKKFDLRTYVLVTSFWPLKVWWYRDGFARVCFENYKQDNNQTHVSDLYSHLTNVSFQKYSSKYNEIHGGKWSIKSLYSYFERNFGKQKIEKLQKDLDQIYLSSLKAVQPLMQNDRHCFELYGYDIMIDENFKCWLIEVNASPSMVGTTKNDFAFKKNLINDLLNVVIPKDWGVEKTANVASTNKEQFVGDFEQIYNEAKDPIGQKIIWPKTVIK